MTKGKIALLGAAMVLVGAGVAGAQGYRDYDRDARSYDDDARVTERVIVHPDYDYIQKRTHLGRANGEINPTEYSISHPVDLADLDMSQPYDRQEMRDRVYQTAVNVCYELSDRMPQLRGSESDDRECVQTATRDAIRDVMDRYHDQY